MNAARPLLPALKDAWTARGWDLDGLRHFRMEGDGGAAGGAAGAGAGTGGGAAGGAGDGGAGAGAAGGTGGDGGTGGAAGGAGTGASGTGGSGEGGTNLGFPDNTPLEQMTVEQREAYWKHQSRKHEGRANARKDYDDLKKKADDYDELVKSTRTEQEKAIEDAKKEAADAARTEEQARIAPQLVAAEFRAVVAGRLTAEQLTSILEPLDSTKFLSDTGEVDTQKVAEYVATIVPAGDGKGGKTGFPNLGQGRRDTGGKPSVGTGSERYAERHASRNRTTST